MEVRTPGAVNIAQVKVYLETQEDSTHIYQNFRIVAPEVHLLRYFTDEMYLGYHALEKAMSKYYVGDGENIIFKKKFKFNNLTTLTFDKVNITEIRPELISAQFMVEAPIPATHGCLDCEHFRESNRMCLYYQILGIKIRKNCPDFRQKEERENMFESNNANLILEIADKLGTTVNQLLAEYGDVDTVIEMYKNGTLKLLSEKKIE